MGGRARPPPLATLLCGTTRQEHYTTECIDDRDDDGRPFFLQVFIPKFRIEEEYALNEHLNRMGMPDAFVPTADLSKIYGHKGLYVSLVKHKAFVKVRTFMYTYLPTCT